MIPQMNLPLFSAFIILGLAGIARSQEGEQTRSRASDSTELVRLEGAWNQAHMKGDASALDRLWADELVVTASGMTPMSKEQSMTFFRSGRMKFQQYTSSEIHVRLLGETAVVTGRIHRKRTIGDRNVEDDWLFTKTYTRRSGRWQVAAWHASLPP